MVTSGGFWLRLHLLLLSAHTVSSGLRQSYHGHGTTTNPILLTKFCCIQARGMNVCQPRISAHVGFFAQLKGELTKKRYKAVTVTVFVNNFLRLQFIHLMQALSSKETDTFKKYCRRASNSSPSAVSTHIFTMAFPSMFAHSLK